MLCTRCVVVVLLLAGVACEDVLIDDYPPSRVVVTGYVRDAAEAPVAGAVVELTPVEPSVLPGDTVVTSSSGAFYVELVTHGARSFQTDLRVRGRAEGAGSAETIVPDIWVHEERRRAPDTVRVELRLVP